MKYRLFAVLIASLAMVGCESDDDNNDSSSQNTYIPEKTIVITSKSSDVIGGVSGDIYQFGGDGWRIIVTESTSIYNQRPSCTGLDKSSAESISIGQTLIVRYRQEDVNYTGSPNVVRALQIEAYRPDCLAPTP